MGLVGGTRLADAAGDQPAVLRAEVEDRDGLVVGWRPRPPATRVHPPCTAIGACRPWSPARVRSGSTAPDVLVSQGSNEESSIFLPNGGGLRQSTPDGFALEDDGRQPNLAVRGAGRGHAGHWQVDAGQQPGRTRRRRRGRVRRARVGARWRPDARRAEVRRDGPGVPQGGPGLRPRSTAPGPRTWGSASASGSTGSTTSRPWRAWRGPPMPGKISRASRPRSPRRFRAIL